MNSFLLVSAAYLLGRSARLTGPALSPRVEIPRATHWAGAPA